MLLNSSAYDYDGLKALIKPYRSGKLMAFSFSMAKEDWLWNAGVKLNLVFSKFRHLRHTSHGVEAFNVALGITSGVVSAVMGSPVAISGDLSLASTISSVFAGVFGFAVEDRLEEQFALVCKLARNYDAIKISCKDGDEYTWTKIDSIVPHSSELIS